MLHVLCDLIVCPAQWQASIHLRCSFVKCAKDSPRPLQGWKFGSAKFTLKPRGSSSCCKSSKGFSKAMKVCMPFRHFLLDWTRGNLHQTILTMMASVETIHCSQSPEDASGGTSNACSRLTSGGLYLDQRLCMLPDRCTHHSVDAEVLSQLTQARCTIQVRFIPQNLEGCDRVHKRPDWGWQLSVTLRWHTVSGQHGQGQT